LPSHIRAVKADQIHHSCGRIIERMKTEDRRQIKIQERNRILHQLIDVKARIEHYDLGEKQTQILDMLIEKAMNAKTYEDLLHIHTKTCSIGLAKQ
jgi:hypothetical protein